MTTVADAIALALRHFQAGEYPQSEQACQDILRADPWHADAMHLLGMIAQQVGRHDLAVEHIKKAIALHDLAVAAFHSNLGLAYQSMGKLDEAAESYRKAIGIRHDFPEAHYNLGNVQQEQRHIDDAIACYRQALAIRPAYAEALNNLGHALQDQGKLEEAIASYRQALAVKPDHVEALNNLGLALQEQGHLDEALANYDRALELKPNSPNIRLNRAMLQLQTRRFLEGWPEYEWRWQVKPLSPLPFTQPVWDGSDLTGRTILLYGEQGLGDTIQFVRYAVEAKRRGGRVILGCQKVLLRILEGVPGVDEAVPFGSPLPAFDVYAPLLSLPGILKTTPETIPAEVPYLSADPDLEAYWRREFQSLPGFKIGIAWQGNPQYKGDRQRSIPLAQFMPLARLEGVHLISLQKGAGTEQMAEVADRVPVLDLGKRLDEESGAFMDSAAILRNLDLMIAPDSAVLHLAGGLGVPVWAAITFAPHWPWMLGREDSPWYPSMRLFRQKQRGDWGEVFRRMARELKPLMAGRGGGRRLTVEVGPGELIDKITILEIKSDRMSDAAKLRNVRTELAALQAARDGTYEVSGPVSQLTDELRTVNETLWKVEDELRRCEASQDFGSRFVELARSVYRQNDRRAALKRKINELLGARIVEEKSYASLKGRQATG
jgi:tetratricopeptide (TPR) repeat protein